MIVHWPNGIQARGELNPTVGHVIDLAPTLLDAAGGKALESWRNRKAPESPGQSLLASFTELGAVARKSPLWFSHDGHRAIRDGDWKLVATKSGPWELYNLASDRNEVMDLAGKHPDKVRKLANQWKSMQDDFITTAKAQ